MFLCGNPAMIGLPKWTDEGMIFPEALGVCQQLHEKGFTIDHRKEKATSTTRSTGRIGSLIWGFTLKTGCDLGKHPLLLLPVFIQFYPIQRASC